MEEAAAGLDPERGQPVGSGDPDAAVLVLEAEAVAAEGVRSHGEVLAPELERSCRRGQFSQCAGLVEPCDEGQGKGSSAR